MIFKRPKAILSINELLDWIIEDSPEIAIKFLESIESSLALLEVNPEIGRLLNSLNPRLSEVRVWNISNFEKHLIFYKPMPDGIEVLDVIHGARDIPGILDVVNKK